METLLDSCHNCTKRGICKWFADVGVSTIGGPGFDFRVRVTDFMTKILQEYCHNFEKERIYESRMVDGTLYGREKLKLWYPNQEPEGCDHPHYFRCRCYNYTNLVDPEYDAYKGEEYNHLIRNLQK